LESSRGALSDGTISFSIQPFPGENAFSEFSLKKPVLKEFLKQCQPVISLNNDSEQIFSLKLNY
jgi:hypothetical protein